MPPVRPLLLVLATCACAASSANILALFTTASPSHHIWNSALVEALALRGHKLTVVGPEARQPPNPNITDLPIEGLYEGIAEDYTYLDMSDMSGTQWISEVFVFLAKGCEITVASRAMKTLMAYPPDTRFDLLLTESMGVECLFGILPRFGNPPIVVINAFSVPPWIMELSGTPNNPSFMPNYMLSATPRMSFRQKVTNLFMNLYGYFLYHYDYVPRMDRVAVEAFGPDIPRPSLLMRNVSIMLANFHPVLDGAWATSPNLVPVAGMQIKEPKPLPLELQEFLDGAKDGAIFFSLGSNVRSDKIPKEKLQHILDAFRELPERVLWKFESEELPGRPPNVKIGKWLPQRDILAHPNVRLFITHAGLLSTHETIERAVPVVGVPILADQHINIRRLEGHGAGLTLPYNSLDKQRLLRALRTVLDDPSYKENAVRLSRRFRDAPQTPLQRAVFWTEFVLRHGDAQHLRPASVDMGWVNYLMLDVLAVVTLGPLAVGLVVASIARSMFKGRGSHPKRH